MRFIDEYRNTELGRRLVQRINRISTKPSNLMEFCGGHTVAVLRHGIRQLFPPHIRLLSGPGCPVCVTAHQDLDQAIALSRVPGTIITTFGDMMKVPGSELSLQQARAKGADVRVVYSPRDSLEIARNNPDKQVIFLAVGFETTAPGVAATILEAERKKIENFCVKSLLKTCPPVIRALLNLGEVRLDGLICPGHVSAVIGSRPWDFIPKEYGIACAVTGFEPLDILFSIERLIEQIEKAEPKVETTYTRGVRPEGNSEAQKLMYQVFEPCPAHWRGLGIVPDSGLRARSKYSRFDADARIPLTVRPATEPKGCLCGEILRGVKSPPDCKLFGSGCTPESPVGPCMVSSEGACAAYYQYGRET
ncbi:MAG: hydrogenase formation protein HypD [Dehalococcoidia bacterium]|nr:hydrogenase formation protein HypD [Dehalococcoidia bacterium]